MKRISNIFMVLFAMLFFTGCMQYGTDIGEPPSDGNKPKVILQIEGLSTHSLGVAGLSAYNHTTADPSLFCFKRLRFKTTSNDTLDPDTDSDNIDFSIGETNISDAGKILGLLEVPEGRYERIEFDLKSADCGFSVRVTNGNGTFDTSMPVYLRFDGPIDITTGTQVIALDVTPLQDVLETIDDGNNIRPELQAVSGVMHKDN
jgi:hypothetical protein